MKIPFRLPKKIGIALTALIFLVYYPIGMVVVQRIDDNTNIDTTTYEAKSGNGSKAVAMAIELVDREINKNHFTPNDPFFYPGAALTRMPAFQRGIMSAVARFSIELNDHLGRSRGSSQSNPDLQKAAGLLNYSPTVWMWDFSVSWFPTASSEKQFNEGIKALKRYNDQIGTGETTFERRSDNLIQTIDRIASDLGSSSAAIDSHIVEHGAFAFHSSADLYYFNKGRMYGSYMLLKSLEQDFAALIAERQIQSVWDAMLVSLKEGAESGHFLVMNANPNNSIFANHMASQGFYLLRARTQMRELTNILLK